MTGNAKLDGDGTLNRVLVAGHDLVVRKGLASLLQAGGQVVVGEAWDGHSAIHLAQQRSPDVALLNMDLRLHDGLHTVPRLSALCPVLVLVDGERQIDAGRALRSGATGFMVHGQFTARELRITVAATARGQRLSPAAIDALAENPCSPPAYRQAQSMRERVSNLSRREAEIMGHVALGRSNPEIARIFFLSEKTVKNHVNRIYSKLKVRSRAAAVALWWGVELEMPLVRRNGGVCRLPDVGIRPDHVLSVDGVS